jgi:hypothetical protein
VKWQGFPKPTWEPAVGLKDCEALEEYLETAIRNLEVEQDVDLQRGLAASLAEAAAPSVEMRSETNLQRALAMSLERQPAVARRPARARQSSEDRAMEMAIAATR